MVAHATSFPLIILFLTFSFGILRVKVFLDLPLGVMIGVPIFLAYAKSSLKADAGRKSYVLANLDRDRLRKLI